MTRARDLAAGTIELATGGVLKLETSDTTVTDGSVLGKIEFKAPDEASGTDAILVGAAIEAVAEGTFAADNNATELVFKTGASAAADTKMVITSGGNLLVGGTTTNHQDGSSQEQFSYINGSFLAVSRSGATVAYFNRQSDDGEIAAFRKNGTTVGGIGTQNGDDFYIASGSTANTGLRFQTGEIVPVTNGAANRDNAIDLGKSNVRFKDLYLSGGALIGGTGAANKLDDYEEGTFTPTFSSGFNSISYTTQKGAYTKIGRLVTIQLQINLDSATGTSGIINFSGLPFNAADSNSAFGGFYKSFNAGFNTNDGDVYHKEGSNAVIGVYSDGGGARVGNNGNIGTGGQIILVGHYYTA